jgi:hypothetical protein
MIRLFPLALLAVSTGCAALFGPPAGIENQPVPKDAAGPTPPPQLVGIQSDIEGIKYAMRGVTSAVEKLETDYKARIEQLDKRLTQVETAAARLIQHLELLSKTPGPQTPAPGVPERNPDAPPPPDPTPIIDVDAVLAEAVGQMRKEMRAGAQESLAERLSAIATSAVPRLVEELRLDPNHIEFSRNFQAVVARLPIAVLARHFREPLTEARTRGTIAETIGRSGDRALGGMLLEYASTTDETFRSQVAEALAKCRHSVGVALLVSQLRSSDETLRTLAILTLKKLNGGHAMGYEARFDPTGKPNVEAIQRWDAWYATRKDTLFKE